jgi:hypothetical protein
MVNSPESDRQTPSRSPCSDRQPPWNRRNGNQASAWEGRRKAKVVASSIQRVAHLSYEFCGREWLLDEREATIGGLLNVS